MISKQDESALLRAACDAAARAYCPYSHFQVGAAVLTESGAIFAGCNVENASYGLTVCAERNAIFKMVSHSAQPLRIKAVLVYTPTAAPTAPCGACRQVLNEFGPDAMVICVCDGSNQIRTTLPELLPQAFGPHNLKGESGTNLTGPPTSP
jgi:cytidine deaminase